MNTVAENKKEKIGSVQRSVDLSESDRSLKIRKWIRFREKQLRKKYRVLQFQDQIGLGIVLFSAAGMIGFGAAYLADFIPAWLCIIANGILASFLHEVEHDTIHNLYYKHKPKVQDFMFWVIWLFRANSVSPWYRRVLHTLHHKVSGRPQDIEERSIGNGMPFGWKRFLVMTDLNMSLRIQGPGLRKDAPRLRELGMKRSHWPTKFFYISWYVFLFTNLINASLLLISSPMAQNTYFQSVLSVVNAAGVVYLLPNWIRQACLQIVSSNMHYYGGIERVFEQTQVLNSLILLPFQLFCFNFGSTHSLHHFVVYQPFYMRQLIAPFAHPAMKKYGIPFNDWKSIFHSNSREYILASIRS